jgi:hypothetical protein
MKIKLLLAAVLFGINFMFSQEVKIKKDKIFVDGNLFLKYEKINVNTHSVYDLDDNEILFVSFKDNETPQYLDDDFYILNFTTEKIKIESSDYSRIASFMNSKKTMQKMIKWLLKDKVINKDGTINSEKLELFFEKYDENITNRTIRY